MTQDWEGGSLEESGKLEEPSYYCRHGVFVGDPYGPDYMCPYCEMGEDPEPQPVTIYDLACYRLDMPDADSLNGADFDRAGLAIMGECEVCHATLAAYNGCPSKTGYWRCTDCIDDQGWHSIEEADHDIFGVS